MKKATIFIIILLISTLSFAQFQQKPILGTQVDRAHPLSKGLVGLWLFNEGSGNIVSDLSGNGNTGTFASANPPRWQANYINFDSGVERIVVPHKGVIDFGTEGFSITVCFRTTASAVQYVCNKNYGGAGIQWWNFFLGTNGTVGIGVDDGTTITEYFSSGGYNDGNWHTGTVVRNTNTGKLEVYVDGRLDGTPATDNTGSVANTGDLYIGCRADLNVDRDFTGDLKFIYIHNRILSASEIAELYREPFGMFVKDDIAILATAAEPPPPPTGQVITIIMTSIPLFLIPFFFIKRRKSVK